MKLRKDSSTWEQVGVVAIDTAELILIDPVNLAALGEEEEERMRSFFDGELDLNEEAAMGIDTRPVLQTPSTALGVAIHTGLGDGLYPVEVKREDIPGWGVRITEVRIRFLPHPILGG